MNTEQQERYSRHIKLPEIGASGQEKLLSAKVLLVGAGGLGSAAGLYLGAAGVGALGVIDADEVDLSNLQRQVLHATRDIGKPKALSAKETIQSINNDVKVTPIIDSISTANAMEIIDGYDVVVDCCDNFATRYIVNDACVALGKPYVYGSVFQFEGQVSLCVPGAGPCYRCIFPDPPPSDVVEAGAGAGVIGVLPGVIGLLQATETIKHILGIGEPLTGRLLLFDALEMRFREMHPVRDPKCTACGDLAARR